MLNKNEYDLAIRCIEIYIGEYTKEQQYAASLLLKMLLGERYFKKLLTIIRESLGFKVNDRQNSKVLSWKKQVKKKGKCEVCGSTEKLVAHHIIPWEYSVKGRTDVENGQCLCERCHKMMHNTGECADYLMGRWKNE